MGLLDWLSAEARQDRKTARAAKKVVQRYGQPEDRIAAAHALAEIGSDEAISALLERFTFTTEKMTLDADEKAIIHDLVVEFGDRAVPLIQKFIQEHDEVALAFRVLEELQSSAEVSAFLRTMLDGLTSEEEDPGKICDLLLVAQEVKDGTLASAIVPMLADFDDTVRFAAIETLDALGAEAARDRMLEMLVNPDEESQRIKLRILETLRRQSWEVRGFRKAVEELLPEGWYLDRAGKIKVLEQMA